MVGAPQVTYILGSADVRNRYVLWYELLGVSQAVRIRRRCERRKSGTNHQPL